MSFSAPRRFLSVTALLLLAAGPAQGEITSVFGGEVVCVTGGDGVRTCSGIVNSFDGAPIDVDVFFPPVPTSGPDGDFPIIGTFHGWNGSKSSMTSLARHFVGLGYAALTMSDRGWGNSCGGTDPKRLQPGTCDNGYNHLMDTRYEVRDAQELFEALADQAADGATGNEGLIDPVRIGTTGSSYGGGISMALAALKNRKMGTDYEAGGTLDPWVSPGGKQMQIAAAAPDIPWTDLAYSLVPTGRTLDYVADSPYLTPAEGGRVGIMKQSFVSGLYGTGLAGSNFAPAGTDEDADVNGWYSLLSAGEPYDNNPLASDLIEEVRTHHSSYYIDDTIPPAPLFISNGFTDDLFPPSEAVRFYNKTRKKHPGANIQLFFSDHGHQRGQNKTPEVNDRTAARDAWLNHFVKGEGTLPPNQVRVWAQECEGDSQGPFTASSWATLPQSEISFESAAVQPISPDAGSSDRGQAYDPIAGPGACATTGSADEPGIANYRLAPAPTGGYTLAGSPTIIADILNPSPNSQIAARLVDIDPVQGTATLVARGLFRPDSGTEAERIVFQLHPNVYVFEEGHIARLELLPNDEPYGRVSNGQGAITVANLDLRLPILEAQGTAGSLDFKPKFIPVGAEPAPGYEGQIDSDGDSIVDPDDDCPSEAGPASSEPGENGCPLPPVDTDADGVEDENDACPSIAGPVENGGCPAEFTIEDLTIEEGNDGSTSADFIVTLSAALNDDVTVGFATADAEATVADNDYETTTETLTITAGTTSGIISIAVSGDTSYETDETFTVTLSNSSAGTTISDAQGVGTIINDDTQPTVSFGGADLAISEGDAELDAVLAIELSAESYQDVTVQFELAGNATADNDYTISTPALADITIPAGSSAASVTVTVVKDDTDDVADSETIELTLIGPANATLGETATRVVTINDIDGVPSVGFASPGNGSVTEGDPGTTSEAVLALSHASENPVTVDFGVAASSSATLGTDFNATPSASATFDPLATTSSITLAAIDDDSTEGTEIATLQIDSADNAVPAAGSDTFVLDVIDDEVEPHAAFLIDGVSVKENAGTLSIDVELSTISDEDISVPFTIGGTASSADYSTVTSGPLVFPAGTTSATIELTVTNDRARENDETVSLTLGTPSNASLGSPNAFTVTIEANDRRSSGGPLSPALLLMLLAGLASRARGKPDSA